MFTSVPTQAQLPLARVTPRGVLSIGFAPEFINWDMRFAENTPDLLDGTSELLGTDLTADTVGPNLFPALGPSETAIGTITGDPSYRMNVGAFNTVLDADLRRLPFDLSFGLTGRLTFTVKVPLVTHRAQVMFTADSTDANVGWNQAIAEVSSAETASEVLALMAQLNAAIADLDAAIAGGSFGCPTGTACDQARAVLADATSLRDNLVSMTGVQSEGANLQTFAPLASSAAGQAITARIAAVAADLQGLGTGAITATLPLPVDGVATEGITQLLEDPTLGYEARPLEFMRETRIGDAEVGLRFGLLQSHAVRAVLAATWRLPTGTVDLPNHFTDLGTGDAQTDFVFGFEGMLGAGTSVGLGLSASYTLQMPDELVRRVAAPDSLLVPRAFEQLVHRNLGDVLTLAAYPTLRLDPAFSVYGWVNYYRKQADRFELRGTPPEPVPFPGLDTDRLERETKMTALSIGGGIAYRSASTPGGPQLPVEAGVNFRSTFSGSGGLTPKSNHVQFYLRLFYRIFGGAAAPEPDPPPSQ